MRMRAFAKRNLKELLRDPLTLFFGLGFPLVLLVLMNVIQRNVPVHIFELETLAPGIALFGLTFLALFSGLLLARDRTSAFLARLAERGVPMYVATATDRPLAEAALIRTGLIERFQGIVTCREAGQGKREGPAVYEAALAALRCAREDALVFEDVLYAVRTAKAAGFRTAAVYDPWEAAQEELRRTADYYVMSYEAAMCSPSS